MFLTLPTVKWKRPERQNLGKPSNLPNPPLLPALGNHACRRQKKTCYLLFLVDSKALSAYSPIPSLSAIICSYFKRRHKEGQTDGRWFEKVKENACLYRTPKCKASNVNDTKTYHGRSNNPAHHPVNNHPAPHGRHLRQSICHTRNSNGFGSAPKSITLHFPYELEDDRIVEVIALLRQMLR